MSRFFCLFFCVVFFVFFLHGVGGFFVGERFILLVYPVLDIVFTVCVLCFFLWVCFGTSFLVIVFGVSCSGHPCLCVGFARFSCWVFFFLLFHCLDLYVFTVAFFSVFVSFALLLQLLCFIFFFLGLLKFFVLAVFLGLSVSILLCFLDWFMFLLNVAL